MGHVDGLDRRDAEVALPGGAGLWAAWANRGRESGSERVAAVGAACEDAERRRVVEVTVEGADAVIDLPAGFVDVATPSRARVEADALREVPLGEVTFADGERAREVASRSELLRVGVERVDPIVGGVRVAWPLKHVIAGKGEREVLRRPAGQRPEGGAAEAQWLVHRVEGETERRDVGRFGHFARPQAEKNLEGSVADRVVDDAGRVEPGAKRHDLRAGVDVDSEERQRGVPVAFANTRELGAVVFFSRRGASHQSVEEDHAGDLVEATLVVRLKTPRRVQLDHRRAERVASEEHVSLLLSRGDQVENRAKVFDVCLETPLAHE